MREIKITQKEFELFRELIYEKAGIALSDHKITLVQGRLSKRLKTLGFNSFMEYYDYLLEHGDDGEIYAFIDSISTNVTSFFREPSQWNFLRDNLEKICAKKREKKLRIWSAACSSGEEPYSIIIFLHEHLKNINEWDIKILATDISTQILKKAQKGEYSQKQVNGLSKAILLKYFDKIKRDDETIYKIKEDIKKDIIFRMFNLVYGNFAIFKNRFDIIFCRNVMIYFDAPTQQKLVSQFAKLLDKGSYLFVGHSEALTRNKNEFKLINSSIYERI